MVGGLKKEGLFFLLLLDLYIFISLEITFMLEFISYLLGEQQQQLRRAAYIFVIVFFSRYLLQEDMSYCNKE